MATTKPTSSSTGQIIQVIGPVVDIEFSGQLPELLEALEVEHNGNRLVLEVQQHVSETVARAIALASTDGLQRGTVVVATGAPIAVPVGDSTLGRMFNVIGEPIDGKSNTKKRRFTAMHLR
jgi:F-type H+/Na+-transporting ATPase subunit beta